jgi:hypothetical protein
VLDYAVDYGILYMFNGDYRSTFIDEVYAHGISVSEVKSSAGKTKPKVDNANADANALPTDKPKQTAKDHIANASKKIKPASAPETEEITRLRSYVAAIYADFPNAKNKPSITAEEYQRLIDKFGYDKLVVMQRVYFEWKAGLSTKPKHTDYGTLIKVDGWAAKRAEELGCLSKSEQPVFSGVCT